MLDEEDNRLLHRAAIVRKPGLCIANVYFQWRARIQATCNGTHTMPVLLRAALLGCALGVLQNRAWTRRLKLEARDRCGCDNVMLPTGQHVCPGPHLGRMKRHQNIIIITTIIIISSISISISIFIIIIIIIIMIIIIIIIQMPWNR